MTYDLLNRTKTIKDGLGNVTSYEYDPAGNVVKETDPTGHVKEYGYDGLNRLTSVKLAIGTWHYEYDGQSNLVKMTDANNHSTHYTFDKKNQLIKETDPLGKSVSYSYDASGNLTQRNDPNGNVVSYKYDELDRLIEKSYPGNIDKYSYDESGNLISAYNNHIAYSFDYDNLNRLLRKNILTWNKSLSYTYDAVGNRKTMTDHDGGVTTYTYDNNNRLTSLTNPTNLTTTFSYDAGGRIKKQTNGNGTFTTYHYDTAGRMDSLINWKNNTEKISFFYYTFDSFGNRKTMTDKRGLNTYTYDSAYRLTNVVYADGSTEGFTMDGSGNRTQRIKNGLTTNYSYNAADQIQTAGPTSFTFDANGNTIGQQEGALRQYRYDGENRLLEAQLNPLRRVQYKYDPFGDKIEKIDTLNNVIRMVYDGDNLLGELNTSNVTQNLYTTAFGMDSWLSMQSGGNTFFYHKDGLNSTVELTGMNATTANQYSYDVYGSVVAQSGIINNKVLFIGRVYESASQLYDSRARFYNKDLGRFINEDEFSGISVQPMSLNRFNYAEGNPTNFVDQDGNSAVSNIGFFGAGIAIGAIWGLGGWAAVGLNAAVGGLSAAWETYFDDKSNQTAECYAYRVGLGAATGAIPITKIAKKIPGLGNIVSKYEKGIEQFGKKGRQTISSGFSKWNGYAYEARRRGSTVGIGLPIEFIAGDLISDGIKGAVGKAADYDPCKKPEEEPKGNEDPLPNPPNQTPETPVTPVGAVDPNEIIGPAGYDTLRWVSSRQNLPYKVLFENDPDFATAPAQNVTIYVPIHPKLNPASLRISDFGFGSFNFTVPANSSVYTNRLDVRDSLGVFVDVTAGLDIANRRAFWVFQSIDPNTGLAATLPVNSGFLPVNDTTKHNGEGYVTYTIQPSSLAQTRDTISAKASIIFDTEETISTNSWVNTIDAVAPTSNINALASVVDSVFTVSWIGQDDANGSGLKDYVLYVSKNNGPFVLYKDKLTTITEQFTGEPGSTLSFYTRATDKAGNFESAKNIGDRVVTVKMPGTSNAVCPGSSVSFNVPDEGSGATYQWQVNTGSGFTSIQDNTIYSGTTGPQLIIQTAGNSYSGHQYRCQITQSGNVTYSAARKLRFSSNWLGIAGESWHNPANWSCGIVPDEFTNVIISGNTPSKPVLNSNGTCSSLTMTSQGSIMFKDTAKLNLTGK
jgi:RHS repeat-associated protein